MMVIKYKNLYGEKMNRYKIVKLGECEEEYFVDTKQKIIDYDDYLEIGTVATMSNKQVLNILNENEKLKKEIEYWKKWALEYLIDYPLYTDEFLDTLKEINGEKFDIEKTKKKQNEIIEILKKEDLW